MRARLSGSDTGHPELIRATRVGGGVAAVLADVLGAVRHVPDPLCVEVGGDEWFPTYPLQARAAQEICGRCTSRPECAQLALDGYNVGVWAGVFLPVSPNAVEARQIAVAELRVLAAQADGAA